MFYIGYTSDINTRLEFHNKAAPQKFTYNADDWKLVFSFECETKLQALAAEKHIKKMKSKIYILHLIKYPKMISSLKDKYKP